MLSDLIQRVADYKPLPFTCPFPVANAMTDVFTVQSGIPIGISTMSPPIPGWYQCHVYKDQIGLDDSSTFERMEYMSLLQIFTVIILYRLDDTTALCVPYNASDAHQRGWRNGAPAKVYLMPNSETRAFELMKVAGLAGSLYYYSESETIYDKNIIAIRKRFPERGVPIKQEHLRNAYNLAYQKWMVDNKLSDKDEIARQVGLVGATVDAIKDSSSGFTVTWTYNGATFSAEVKKSGRVISAGICLSGRDREQTVQSLIPVMEEARRLHRFDVDEEYYI